MRKGCLKVRSKVWFEKDGELVFGTGKAAILRAVAETGSINKAARKLGMSYRHAWSYISFAEKRLGRGLLIKTKGGRAGGGAVLTKYAGTLLEKFEKLDREAIKFVDQRYTEMMAD